MFKNVSGQKIAVFAFDAATGLPMTGDAANITAYVSKDFGTVTVLTDTSATEMSSTNAPGWYLFDVSQTESNADALLFTGKSSTSDVSVVGQLIYTVAANFSTLSIDSNGRVDTIKIAGTTQTARDLGASVLLSSGTGTGQLDFTSGVVKANATQILGTAVSTPATAGVLDVNLKNIANAAVSTSTAQLGVNVVNNAGSAITSAAGIQEVKVASMADDSVSAGAVSAAAVTKVQAGLATPTNITAGTITTCTNLTNAPTNGDLTATMKTSVTTAATAATPTAAAVTGNVGGNVVGSVGSVVGAVGSVTGNVGGSVGSVATGGITRASLAADTGLQAIRSSTAQAGAAGTITLDASASATDDFYNDDVVYITGGTGVGQVRRVTDYVGATKVATVKPNWTTTPDNTSTFAVMPMVSVWDEVLADHLDAGSTGFALNAAGAAGDPWLTALPGAYGAGSAGYIVGTNIDALISSRLAPTVAARTLDVSAGGEAGVDWANVGSPTSTVNLSGTTVGVVTSLAAGAIAAASFASAALDAIANIVLGYNMSSVTGAASRSLLNAIRFLRNKWSISGTTLTVTQEDDTTSAWTATLTTNASAEPITSSDPA